MVKKTSSELDSVAEFYNNRYEVEGDSIKSVGWSTRESQFLRFKVLLESFDPKGKVILDVGCGLGDLVPYLQEITGGDFKYIGLDISDKMIEKARSKYPSEQCQFVVGDILSVDFDMNAIDYVVESGAFSFKILDNYGYLKKAMARMYEIAREGIALNFMTSHVDFTLEKNFHYEPEKVFSWAHELSRFVSLSHDYKLWEFTVRILKSPKER